MAKEQKVNDSVDLRSLINGIRNDVEVTEALRVGENAMCMGSETELSAARNAEVEQHMKELKDQVGQNSQQEQADEKKPTITDGALPDVLTRGENAGELSNQGASEEPAEDMATEEPQDDISISDEPEHAEVVEKKQPKKWMKKAFGKNKGGLHRALGVDPDKKIPQSKLNKATHSKDSHVRHMAQAAKNANEGCGAMGHSAGCICDDCRGMNKAKPQPKPKAKVEPKQSVKEMAGEADHYNVLGMGSRKPHSRGNQEAPACTCCEAKLHEFEKPYGVCFACQKANESTVSMTINEKKEFGSSEVSDFRSMFDGTKKLNESVNKLMSKFKLNEEEGLTGSGSTVAVDASVLAPREEQQIKPAQNPETFDKADKTPDADEHGEKQYFGKQGDDNYYYLLLVTDDEDASLGGMSDEEKPDVTPDVRTSDMAPVEGEEELVGAHESKLVEGDLWPYYRFDPATGTIKDEEGYYLYDTDGKTPKVFASADEADKFIQDNDLRGTVIESIRGKKFKLSEKFDVDHPEHGGENYRDQAKAAYLNRSGKPQVKKDEEQSAKELEELKRSWDADNSTVPNESKVHKIRESFSSAQVVDASGKVVADAEQQKMDPNNLKAFLLQCMDDLELTEIAPDTVKDYLLAPEEGDEVEDDEMTETPEEEKTIKNQGEPPNKGEEVEPSRSVASESRMNEVEDNSEVVEAVIESKTNEGKDMADSAIDALLEKFDLVDGADYLDALLEKYGLTDDGIAALMEKFKLDELSLRPAPPQPGAPSAPGTDSDEAPAEDPRDQDLTGQTVTPGSAQPAEGGEAPAGVEPATGEADLGGPDAGSAGAGAAPLGGGAAAPIPDVKAQDMNSPESAKAYIQSEYPEEPYTSTALAYADSMIADPAVYGKVRNMQWGGIWGDSDTLQKQAKIVGDYGNFNPGTVKAITDKFGNSAKYKLAREVRPVIFLTVRDVGAGVEPTSLSELKGISGAREVVATENPGEAKIIY